MLAGRAKAQGGLEVRPLGDGKAIIVGSALCGGRSYALLEGFMRSCARLAGCDDTPLYEAMNRLGMEMLEDASKAAMSDSGFETYNDVFGSEG